MKRGKIKFFIAFVGLIILASYSPKLTSSVEEDPCVVSITNNNGVSIGNAYVYRHSNGIVTIKEATSSYPFPAEFYPAPIYEGIRQDNDIYDVITRQGEHGIVTFPFTGRMKVDCSDSGRALEIEDRGVGDRDNEPTTQPTTRPRDSDGDGCLDGQILCEQLGFSNGRKDRPEPFEICCPLASAEKAERGACNYDFKSGFPFCDFECPSTHETCRVEGFNGFACCDKALNRCGGDYIIGPYCEEIPCSELSREACELNTKCEVIPCDGDNQISGRFTVPIGNAFGCTLFGQDLGFDLLSWLGGGNGGESGEERFCGCREKIVNDCPAGEIKCEKTYIRIDERPMGRLERTEFVCCDPKGTKCAYVNGEGRYIDPDPNSPIGEPVCMPLPCEEIKDWDTCIRRLDCVGEADPSGFIVNGKPSEFTCKSKPACSNGLDDDRDGHIDTEDPGCNEGGTYNPNDNDETNIEEDARGATTEFVCPEGKNMCSLGDKKWCCPPNGAPESRHYLNPFARVTFSVCPHDRRLLLNEEEFIGKCILQNDRLNGPRTTRSMGATEKNWP